MNEQPARLFDKRAWLPAMVVGVVSAGLGMWYTRVPPAPAPNPVEEFRDARNKDPRGGKELLAPDPVFGEDVTVSEEEAEARQAGYFLHGAREVRSVRAGEPGPGGKWLKTPGRYTLATRVNGSTPLLRVKVGDRVEAPSRLFMIDPDIVVEVRDGKLHALRAELHSD